MMYVVKASGEDTAGTLALSRHIKTGKLSQPNKAGQTKPGRISQVYEARQIKPGMPDPHQCSSIV